jgi:hypothetical protein
MSKSPFDAPEVRAALVAVVSFFEPDERRDFEDDPRPNHIYEQLRVLRIALAKKSGTVWGFNRRTGKLMLVLPRQCRTTQGTAKMIEFQNHVQTLLNQTLEEGPSPWTVTRIVAEEMVKFICNEAGPNAPTAVSKMIRILTQEMEAVAPGCMRTWPGAA